MKSDFTASDIPVCSEYKKCNGCQLLNMSYLDQLAYKQKRIERLFKQYCNVNTILGMDYPYYYRNKVQAVFRTTKNRKIVSGIYQSQNKGLIVQNKCITQDRDASKILVTIRQLLEKYKISALSISDNNGWLKSVLIRKGLATGEIMVVLVADSLEFKSEDKFIEKLLKAHPNIKSVILNLSKSEKLLLGKKSRVLFGDFHITDILCGYYFHISPNSFYQINHDQTEILYNYAIGIASLSLDDTLFDAYCGIGTIGIIASKKCNRVISVENNNNAVQDAITNARFNGVNNIDFYHSDAGVFLSESLTNNFKIDVAILDPPRSGCSMKFLKALSRRSLQRIVYISCNPDTQIRDCRFLLKNGYSIINCQPVDMFPNTNHVETVVLLSRESK